MASTSRLLTLLACLACARVAHAQVAGGAIDGVVNDEQHVGVPGVRVTAHGFEQSQVFKTESDGRFRLHDLVPGRYVVTVALDGFTTLVRTGVTVRVGKTANLPFVMKVVRTKETVTVTAPLITRQENGGTDANKPAAVLLSRNPVPVMTASIPADRVH